MESLESKMPSVVCVPSWHGSESTRTLDSPRLNIDQVERDAAETRRRPEHNTEQRRITARCYELFENARDAIYIHDLNGRYLAVNKAGATLVGRTREEILRMNISDFVPAEYMPGIRQRIQEKLARPSQTVYEVEVISKDGRRIPVEVNSQLIYEKGVPVAIQGIARNITDRKRLEREREAMFEIIRSVSTSANLDDLLQRIHASISKILYAENCFVALCDEETGMLSMQFFVDQYDDAPPTQQMGKSCAAEVFRTGRPLLITDDIFAELVGTGQVELVGKPSPSWLGVPLQTPARMIGVLVVQHYEDADAYSDHDLEFLSSVGSQIAIAIERKKSEGALRDSEARLTGIIESAMDAIVTVDGQRRIIIFNKTAETIFGCKAEEVIGTSINRFIPPPSQAAFDDMPEFRNCGMSAQPIGTLGSITGVRANGEQFPLEASIAKVVAGDNSYCTVILRDVTERRRAEEALENRAHQQAVVAELGQYALKSKDVDDLMNVAVQVIADSLQVEYCKVLELLPEGESLVLRAGIGWNQKTEIGRATVSAGADSQAGYTLRSSAPVIVENLLTETRFKGPVLLQQHGVVSGLSVIIGGNGHPFGVLGAHSTRSRTFTQDDINFLQAIANLLGEVIKRQRAEDALRSSQLQLQQSQRLEAIGQLAGGVAHDFNNLLTAIMGYSDLTLAKLGPNDPIARNLREIKKAGERATALTRQLLAFSRKQILETQTLDLNSIIGDLNKMLRRLIGEDITLMTNYAGDLGTVKADPTQIEQVIMNLVVNARDAMPQGGNLIIETRNVTFDEAYQLRHQSVAAGNYVMVAVSDNGCGMDAETQARIFEPFFTTKEFGKGTGLGLSTIYGIVKQSDGYVWVYSEPGEGTTFKVYLPRVYDRCRVERADTSTEPIQQGNGTLLLVEDDSSVRDVTGRFLEAAGYSVLQASGGKQALEIVARHGKEICLVITDVVMPEMSGRELSHRLSELLPDARVLFISGYTDDAIVRAGIGGKNIAFLEKPFTPQMLARKVAEVLRDVRPSGS